MDKREQRAHPGSFVTRIWSVNLNDDRSSTRRRLDKMPTGHTKSHSEMGIRESLRGFRHKAQSATLKQTGTSTEVPTVRTTLRWLVLRNRTAEDTENQSLNWTKVSLSSLHHCYHQTVAFIAHSALPGTPSTHRYRPIDRRSFTATSGGVDATTWAGTSTRTC